MMDGGVFRLGKCERSGVPGGGRMSENSAARGRTGVCFVERAIRRFVPSETTSRSEFGVMSGAKAERASVSKRLSRKHAARLLFASGANMTM